MKPAPVPSVDVRPAWAKEGPTRQRPSGVPSDPEAKRWFVLRRQPDRSWLKVYGPNTHAMATRARDAFEKRYPLYEYVMVGAKRA